MTNNGSRFVQGIGLAMTLFLAALPQGAADDEGEDMDWTRPEAPLGVELLDGMGLPPNRHALKITEVNREVLQNAAWNRVNFNGLQSTYLVWDRCGPQGADAPCGQTLDVRTKLATCASEGPCPPGQPPATQVCYSPTRVDCGDDVAFARAVSGADGERPSYQWIKGRKVIDGGVGSGTVIAKWTPGGTLQNAMIFKGYRTNTDGAITGIYVWQQGWDYDNSNPFMVKRNLFTKCVACPMSDSAMIRYANSYHVVMLPGPGPPVQ